MAFMSNTSKTIHDVVVQIYSPNGDYPGQVCEGCYTLEGQRVSAISDDAGRFSLSD
jgi:hypothetical protein